MSPPPDPEAPESSTSSARRQVVIASLILIGAIFVSRISGMARVVAFSYRFGASGMTSAYNQAFGLPDLVNMLIGG
ncbi:MAG TPA: virulence factor MviN, partial [Armatimonadota bacterium]|nr:virulence factor MviN [Armatimonadota bacterium]